MEINDYKIVTAKSADTLEDKVIEGIAHGWQPLGGVCASTKDSEVNRIGLFSQAMVKYDVLAIVLR